MNMQDRHDESRTEERRKRLIELADEESFVSQDQIVDRLQACGFEVSQASVSRDLKAVGLAKIGGRYVRLNGNGPDSPQAPPGWRVLSSIKRMMPAGPNLIVIHTHTGAANSVGVAIDGWRDSDLVGSVAGDDTIFLAVPSRAAQDRLMRKLKQLAERSG